MSGFCFFIVFILGSLGIWGKIKCEFLMSVSKSNARSHETGISTERRSTVCKTTLRKLSFIPNYFAKKTTTLGGK